MKEHTTWELLRTNGYLRRDQQRIREDPCPRNLHLKSNSDRRGRGKILNLTEVKPQMPERSLRKESDCLDITGSQFLSLDLWLHMRVYSLWKITHCIHIQILYFSMNLLYCLVEDSDWKWNATRSKSLQGFLSRRVHQPCRTGYCFQRTSWSLERVGERINILLRRQTDVGSTWLTEFWRTNCNVYQIVSCPVESFSKYLLSDILACLGFPGGASGKELTCQCRRNKRHWFNPWVGKIP